MISLDSFIERPVPPPMKRRVEPEPEPVDREALLAVARGKPAWSETPAPPGFTVADADYFNSRGIWVNVLDSGGYVLTTLPRGEPDGV